MPQYGGKCSQRFSEKGKPFESVGRKGMGLMPALSR